MRIGGGAASSSLDEDGERAGWGGEVGGCLELRWQKEKKLGILVSIEELEGKIGVLEIFAVVLLHDCHVDVLVGKELQDER